MGERWKAKAKRRNEGGCELIRFYGNIPAVEKNKQSIELPIPYQASVDRRLQPFECISIDTLVDIFNCILKIIKTNPICDSGTFCLKKTECRFKDQHLS
jgi:hypothetical protein